VIKIETSIKTLRLKNEATIKKIGATKSKSQNTGISNQNIIPKKIAPNTTAVPRSGCKMVKKSGIKVKMPAQWTDFIFCVPAEEFGFIGSVIILLLYLILLWRVINLASTIRQKFASLVAIGIFSTWAFHIVVNIGMTLGLFPVIGIWLPFLSYGGSAMWINMAMVGLLLNFYANRRELS